MKKKSQCINKVVMHNANQLQVITPSWDAPNNITAFTTTTYDGVSKNQYKHLNLGNHVGDNPEDVQKNRLILQEHIGANIKLRWLNQIHSSTVADDNQPYSKQIIDADASITKSRNVACIVMTADCLPILLTDTKTNKVAAIHCGWQGLYKNIISKTIKLFPNNEKVIAWLGPAISQKNYEVNQNFYQRFVEKSNIYKSAFFYNREGHYLCDLYQLAIIELKANKILSISGGDYCTFDDNRFFSYRKQNSTGRIASLIYKC